MTRRNWKRIQPTSLRHALELCKDHAREVHNLSVERIAERLVLPDYYVLYKWIQGGRMPAIYIPAYEAACGINFVTRWLASAGGVLLIPMPTGRTTTPQDVLALQELLNAAAGRLIQFHNQKAGTDETLADIRSAMEALGFHHANVKQHATPQLELGDAHE